MIKFQKEIRSILRCQRQENEKIRHVFLFENDGVALLFVAALMQRGLKPFIEPWFESVASCRPEMFLGYRVGVKFEHLVQKSFYEKKLMNLK